MNEISRKEKEAGVFPDPDIDVFMKVISILFSVHCYSVTILCEHITIILCFFNLKWTVNIDITDNGFNSCHIVESILMYFCSAFICMIPRGTDQKIYINFRCTCQSYD